MNFSLQEQNPGKKAMGIGFAILFHVALIWGLVNELGTTGITRTKDEGTVTFVPPMVVKPVDPVPVIKDPIFKEVKVPYIEASTVLVNNQTSDHAIDVFTLQKPTGDSDGSTEGHGTIAQPVRTPAIVDARACEKPDYPSRELREGIEGVTALQFLIGVDGRVIESRIARSSGSRALDNAALAGLTRCTFKAGTVDGKPEQSWTKIQYAWKIE